MANNETNNSPATPLRSPQLTLFLDTAGIIHAEAPGTNGMRRKLDIDQDAIPYWIRAELLTQAQEQRKIAEREHEKTIEHQRKIAKQNLRYIQANHPTLTHFFTTDPQPSKPASNREAIARIVL